MEGSSRRVNNRKGSASWPSARIHQVVNSQCEGEAHAAGTNKGGERETSGQGRVLCTRDSMTKLNELHFSYFI